jgi:AcrR family transcriptional regulator
MKQLFFQLAPEKRGAIVSAAIAEFGAHDFDSASLDRIVSAAGISKGGLYEYIASKEELYLFCMEQVWSSLYRFIAAQASNAGAPLPADVLDRFMSVSQIAIEWYLQHPAMLGLIVRTARLPRAALAAKAQAVFESHFSVLFSGLDSSRLDYPAEQVVDLIKWLLARTRQDALLEIAAGRSVDEVRQAYLEQWAFFCSVLGKGIYRTG